MQTSVRLCIFQHPSNWIIMREGLTASKSISIYLLRLLTNPFNATGENRNLNCGRFESRSDCTECAV